MHPFAGGAERTIYEVGRRLTKYGHEVKWFSVKTGSLPFKEDCSGISIIRFPSNIIAHLMAPIMLQKEEYDVVVDDMGHAVPWGSENFANSKGTVFFRHLHRRTLKGQVSSTLGFLISGLEAFYPLIYRDWSFVTESNSSINDLVNLGIGRERIVKILPGLGEDNFGIYKKSSSPTIVYYGGMRDYKRPWEPLYVLKELIDTHPNTHLFMVGSGPALERVIETSKSVGVTEHVTFTGRLSTQELREIVGAAWMNIHSSLAEGFGLSIIEASALGTPTVAYDVPGVNETVDNGKNGVLVENGNSKLMAEAIIKVIDQYSDCWVQSPRDVARKYSWEKTARMWERHLMALCE